jgi:hypothetical protein
MISRRTAQPDLRHTGQAHLKLSESSPDSPQEFRLIFGEQKENIIKGLSSAENVFYRPG